MRHAILKTSHLVLLSAIKERIVINEYETDESDGGIPKTFFWLEEPTTLKDHMGSCFRGDNLLEAVASIIEWTILNMGPRGYPSKWSNYDPINVFADAHTLMMELGKENLPLLINFFQTDQAKKILTDLLRGA